MRHRGCCRRSFTRPSPAISSTPDNRPGGPMSTSVAMPIDIDVNAAAELPAPPDDDELYSYFGPQRRWVLLAVSLSYTFTAVTLFLFALRHPALWVFLGVLALNITGLALSVVDGQRPRRITR